MKNKYILFLVIISLLSCKQKTDTNQTIKKNTIEFETKKVDSIMTTYKDAIEKLDVTNINHLFSKDALVFESGSKEGTFKNYLSHHLEPELKHFKSFTFSDYKIDTKIDLPFAFVNETYQYRIVIPQNTEKNSTDLIIQKRGVATSVLKKQFGKWKIIQTHMSSRNLKK